jgi:hypothetical protein
VEEIAHAGGRCESSSKESNSKDANNHSDRSFTTDEKGVFQNSTDGQFKAWHKTTAQCAGKWSCR